MARRAHRVGPLAALLAAACGPAPAPAPPPAPLPPPSAAIQPAPASAPVPSAPVPPAPAPPPPAPSPAGWALVYHRDCRGGLTPPIVSADGKTVVSCGALFEVERGHFLRAARDA